MNKSNKSIHEEDSDSSLDEFPSSLNLKHTEEKLVKPYESELKIGRKLIMIRINDAVKNGKEDVIICLESFEIFVRKQLINEILDRFECIYIHTCENGGVINSENKKVIPDESAIITIPLTKNEAKRLLIT